MRYFLLTFISFLFSCEQPKNQDDNKPVVIPNLDLSTDTIANGGTLQLKGYLTFKPELTSPEQANEIVTSFTLKFDGTGQLDPFRTNAFETAELKGDTAYGEFVVNYANTDSLNEHFEHVWNAALIVTFKTETEQTVDTTYMQEFKVVVKK
jgi:hypothetical protein